MSAEKKDSVKPWLSALDPEWQVDLDTVKPVGEGVWFAWRTKTARHNAMGDVRNGVYWLEDGSKVVSLAMGTGLHTWGTVDWETFVFRPENVDIDVCCHDSEDAAEKCALTFFATGSWCRGSWEDDAL